LRGLSVEQREESGAVAAHALGLRGDAVELGLLLRLRFLVTADLFFLGGIAAAGAAIDGDKLSFQPLAHRISLRALLRRRRWRRHRAGGRLGKTIDADRHAADQHGAGEEPSGEGCCQRLQHIRPLKRFRGAADKAGTRGPRARRGQGGLPTRFSGHRHVVLGAPVWREGCNSLRNRAVSALAGDGHVFVTAGVAAFLTACLRNRAGDFIGINAAEGGRLREIARLAIGPRRGRAAFVAFGEALVDAIAVRFVGDDEYFCIGGRRRRSEHEGTG